MQLEIPTKLTPYPLSTSHSHLPTYQSNDRPPKKSFFPSSASGSSSPQISLADEFSYFDAPKPFKNLAFKKNVGRRSKSVKQTLVGERERGEKVNREARERAEEDARKEMEVDGVERKRREVVDVVTCEYWY